ncbi:MAG: XrtA system polysaccharide chain length determinant [Betaproteobacteria bacterium]
MEEIIQQLVVILRSMWLRRWAGLAVAWVAAVVGLIVVSRMPDRYEAEARVYVDTQTVLKPLLSGLAVQPDVNQQVTMMARTLITRPNVEKLIRASDMDLGVQNPKQMDALVEDVTKRLKLSGGGRENIYDISSRDTNPALAKRVVQNVVSMFVESGLGDKKRDAETARRFLDEQIKSYEKQLLEAEDRLKNFKLRNLGVAGAGGATDYVSRIGGLNEEIGKLRMDLRAAEQSRDAIKRELAGEDPVMLPEPGSGSAGSPVPEVDARTKAAAATPGRYTPSTNPVFQQLKSSLAEQEANVAALRARLGELQGRMDAMRASAGQVPQVEAELSQMNRDYEVLRKNYEALVGRRESARMTDSADATAGMADFRVIDPPRVSPTPVFPNRLVFVALALAAALAAGVVASFILSQLFPRIQDAKTLRTMTNRPVLGSVSLLLDAAMVRKERVLNVAFASGVGMLMLMFGAWLGWIAMVSQRV